MDNQIDTNAGRGSLDCIVRHFSFVFDYDMECARYDCPSDDVGEWLNNRAREFASAENGEEWHVLRSRLEKQEDGHTLYFVYLSNDLALPQTERPRL